MTYSQYKDSGVEWIGEIPVGWKFASLKYYFDYTKGSEGQKLSSSYIGEHSGSYPVYSGKTVGDGILGFIDEYEFDYSFPLIFTTTVGAKSMTTKLLEGKFSLSQNCLVMIMKRECNPSFIQKFLSYDFIFRKDLLPTILQPSLRMEDLDQYKIVIPPIQEQQKIANFLDYKTQQVDSLIEKTQQKIELLKEQRTALINQVVTKGLDPDAEMKDSGVEWIGEIPVGWEIIRSKYIGRLYGGITGKSGGDFNNDEHEDNKPFIPFTNIANNMFISMDHFGQVSIQDGENQHRVQINDIFFLMSSEGHEDLGKSSILIDDVEELYLNSFCKGFRIFDENAYPIFVNYQLSGYIFKELLSIEGRGFTRINLKQGKIYSLRLLLPPIQEQQEIVEYLDSKTQQLDSQVEKERKRIELLKEYRNALISEVVTGKIDVREEMVA